MIENKLIKMTNKTFVSDTDWSLKKLLKPYLNKNILINCIFHTKKAINRAYKGKNSKL